MITNFADVTINYWAVIAGVAIAMVTGMIWYGPGTLGKLWMKWNGLDNSNMNGDGVGKLYALQLLASLVMTYVLAHFVAYFGVTDFFGALTLGFWIWLGFLVAGGAGIYIFPPKRWELFLFDSGYKLVSIVLIAWVLAVWR